MSAIHMMLQGKGGVGKSLAASLLTQYLMSKISSDSVCCIDADPVNDTFSGYKAFPVKRIDILNKDKNINARAFDGLIEQLVGHDGVAVVDNGSSTFVPLSAYMIENNVVPFLTEMGKTVYIHTVLTGGQGLDDTMTGLNTLLSTQPAQIVVWENEYFGEVIKEGKRFIDSKMYDKNKERIQGIVTIHRRNHETYVVDMEYLAAKKMTFDEGMSSGLFEMMAKQRLRTMQRSIYDQLAHIGM